MLMWVDVRPGDPALVPVHGGLRRPHVPVRQRRRRVDVREVPLEAEAGHAVGAVERGGEDQRRRSRLPPPRPVGRDPVAATSPSGSSACRCSTTTSPTSSTSTSSTPPSSSPRSSCRSAPIGRLVLDRVVDNFFAETEQVAFCTQNIVPGIDFTNDPLLQGRNFSYLDTQLKRLGGPNFTHLPINAPKCPFAHFQQDGHMAMPNPVGRVNYEPNSCDRRRARPARGSRAAGSPRSRGRGRARSAGSGPRPSPTTTARPASSSSARRRSSRSTSSTRSSSSCPRSSDPRSASGWSPTCATSTTTSPAASPTASAWPALADATTRPRQPDRTTCRRRRRSASSATGPTRSPGASSASSSPTAPTPSVLAALAGGGRGRGRDRRAHRARRSAASTLDDGTLLPAEQKVDGGPSVLYDAVAVVASGDGRRRARRACPRPRTSSPTPTPTASSSAHARRGRAVRRRRPHRPRSTRLRRPRRRRERQALVTRSAVPCASGSGPTSNDVVVVGGGAAAHVPVAAAIGDCGRAIEPFASCRPTLDLAELSPTPHQGVPARRDRRRRARPRLSRGTPSTRSISSLGCTVDDVDIGAKSIATSEGPMPFGCWCSPPVRRQRGCPVRGGDLDALLSIRSLADARRVIGVVSDGGPVTVIGSGFVGCEAATSLRARPRRHDDWHGGLAAGRSIASAIGGSVDRTVVARGRRPPDHQRHRRVDRSDTGGDGCPPRGRRRGRSRHVLVASGARPNVELAATVPLSTDHGVVADSSMRTAVPGIWAIGDIANVYNESGSPTPPCRALGRRRGHGQDRRARAGRPACRAVAAMYPASGR